MSENENTDTTVVVEFDFNTSDDTLSTVAVQKLPVTDAEKIEPSEIHSEIYETTHVSIKERKSHDGEVEDYSYTVVFPKALLMTWYNKCKNQNKDKGYDEDDVREEFEELCVEVYNVVASEEVEDAEELRDVEDIDIDSGMDYETGTTSTEEQPDEPEEAKE